MKKVSQLLIIISVLFAQVDYDSQIHSIFAK